MNICGCLIHVAPRHKERAIEQIEIMDGCEVHAHADDGRCVVVVEDTPERFASDTIMALHQIPGVVSLSITYHHFEDALPAQTSADRPKGNEAHDHI